MWEGLSDQASPVNASWQPTTTQSDKFDLKGVKNQAVRC